MLGELLKNESGETVKNSYGRAIYLDRITKSHYIQAKWLIYMVGITPSGKFFLTITPVNSDKTPYSVTSRGIAYNSLAHSKKVFASLSEAWDFVELCIKGKYDYLKDQIDFYEAQRRNSESARAIKRTLEVDQANALKKILDDAGMKADDLYVIVKMWESIPNDLLVSICGLTPDKK